MGSMIFILCPYWFILAISVPYRSIAKWFCQHGFDSHSILTHCGIWHNYSNPYVSTAQYFGATILLIATSTALTVLVLNVHHRGSLGNPVPPVVELVVLNWLAKILRIGKWAENRRQTSSTKMVTVNKSLSSKYLDDGPILCFISASLFESCIL